MHLLKQEPSTNTVAGPETTLFPEGQLRPSTGAPGYISHSSLPCIPVARLQRHSPAAAALLAGSGTFPQTSHHSGLGISTQNSVTAFYIAALFIR